LIRALLLGLALVAVLATRASDSAAVRQEYRALWVDTFNTTLNNHADILRVVTSARAARMNVLLAQVRRRGDAWYLDTSEPPPDFVPIEPGFDPLADLIATAHTFGLEVHAFVIAGAIWNEDPALPPTASTGPPRDPRHVFNRHGGYRDCDRTISQGPEMWLTRTLVPDGAGIAYAGHRINNEFWLDFGHPEAATYTVEVFTDLVRRYDVDGLHLDRIRYPELTAAGQTPTAGASIGYNPTSVARFKRRHGLDDASAPPSPGDARWAAWRRAQVTNLVRRIYLNAIAVKPSVVVSAAVIAFGGGPTTDQAWLAAEAYWRVYQDWRAWLEEGILDLAIVMNYKRDHDATQMRQFDEWSAWVKSHQYGRTGLIGLGAFLNTAENTRRQTERALADDRDARAAGVAFFSLASPTDTRNFDAFASTLTSDVFREEALVPVLAWKQAPIHGHVMGVAILSDGTTLDTVSIRLTDARTGIARTIDTDGSGFFGFVDVPPGAYTLRFAKSGAALRAQPIDVAAGQVTAITLTATP
jgi:uncharacterized lipoprotein YddW (UPF0748 family)